MKNSSILVCFALSVIVEGNLLAAANRYIQPMIISCGAALFAAMGQEDKINFNSLHDWKQKFNENVFSRKEEDG